MLRCVCFLHSVSTLSEDCCVEAELWRACRILSRTFLLRLVSTPTTSTILLPILRSRLRLSSSAQVNNKLEPSPYNRDCFLYAVDSQASSVFVSIQYAVPPEMRMCGRRRSSKPSSLAGF